MEPSIVLGSGYSESKWVAERVMALASDGAGVPTVAVRLGQVCGDRVGHWNEREWFPSLVKSALFQKCLPEHDGVRYLCCPLRSSNLILIMLYRK